MNDLAGHPGRERAAVRVETETAFYVGHLVVPVTGTRVQDALADDGDFLHLYDVSIGDEPQVQAYVAINKSFVRSVRVLEEGLEDARPITWFVPYVPADGNPETTTRPPSS